MISTRGRYALRVLIDLAEYEPGERIPLKDIADREQISRKYLESIMTMLSKADMVDAIHGKGGGFALNRSPEDYSVGELLRLTENNFAPVACLEAGASPCEKAGGCKTLPVWTRLNNLINGYLDSVTLADLMAEDDNRAGGDLSPLPDSREAYSSQ